MSIIKNNTLKSAAWYTFSNILSKAMTLMMTPVFSRVLSKNEYGEYTNFISWQNILVSIFSLELSSTVLRAKFDKDNEKSFNSYVFTISCFSILISFVLSILLCALHKFTDINNIMGVKSSYMWLLCLILVFSPLLQIFQAQQRAEIKYKFSSVVTILFGILSFVFPIIFSLNNDNKLEMFLFGITVNSVLWGIVVFAYVVTRKREKIYISDIRYALVFSLPIIPHIVSSIVMGNSDKIMIRNMCGSEFAAVYGLVYTCALAITLLRNSLNNAWTPWFYQKMNDQKFGLIKQISKTYIILFSLLSLFVCLLGPELISLLGGNQYKDSIWLVPIIMLGCYYNFLYLFYVNIEFYYKKTVMISIVTVFTALLNLILNYIFISKTGYIAAAYTTALCNMCTVYFHYLVTKKMENQKICDNKFICFVSIVSVISMFYCLYTYKNNFIRYITIFCLVLISFIYIIKEKKKGVLL